MFFLDLMSKLPKYTGINNYTIKLIKGQQLPYGIIYSLKLVELETLKIYIETNLANRFIRLSKLPVGTSIFFDQKLDRSFWLYVNYRGLNNLIIKNCHPLSLIGKLLDKLGKI